LFALNEEYCLNEKGALLIADRFPLKPINLKENIERAFTLLSADGQSIGSAIAALEEVSHDLGTLLK